MIPFTLDGRNVEAEPGETIWRAAKRLGTEIPHLCHIERPGYRSDGNCRACVVEIEGERLLAPSCQRLAQAGMKVSTNSERVTRSRRMVLELLLADCPEPAEDTPLRRWIDEAGLTQSRFPARPRPAADNSPDNSHPAITVDLGACIHCTLCLRACREVQVNDVIGMAGRGSRSRIVFDFGDPLGNSTCVACGECVQVCPSGALSPSQAIKEVDDTVETVCPYCGVGCRTTLQVKDNRVVHVDGADGPANRGRLCVKGRFGLDYASHGHRLTKPLIRLEGAAKETNPHIDPGIDPGNPLTHFREASWEEALDRAAEGFLRVREQHGPSFLGALGSAKGSNEEGYLLQKLVRIGFGSNNVDHCARLCHAPSVAALIECIGSGAVTAPFTDCLKADAILVIGADPPVNHPVAATFIKNAAKAGTTLIACDPRANHLFRHATHAIRHKPGSDVALLNAMMHVIVAEDLHDQAFIDARTEGFEAFKEHLADYAPEDMAALCGVNAQTIRAIARAYATAERAMIFWGMGITQHVHGANNVRSLAALALMCGQVGREGCGLHPLRGQNNVQGVCDVGVLPSFLPGYQRVADDRVRRKFEGLWKARLSGEAGRTLVEMTQGALDASMKAMFIMGENPAMSDPDSNTVRRALRQLDHLVVQDIFLTETAMFADVVLPASALLEKTGTFTNSNRQIQLGRRALGMPGEARQDWWILQDLGRRLGLEWNYSGPADIFEDLRLCWPALKGIPWQRLERQGSVTHPCNHEDEPGMDVLMGETFATANGKGKFVAVDIVSPDELPCEDFPMVLTTGRLLEHWHTGAMSRRSAILDGIEPEAVAHLAPADLSDLGVEPGDQVVLTTRRGNIKVAARADAALPQGLVFVPFCYVEAPGNALTNAALDPIAKIPEYKYCAVRVEKVTT